MACKVFIGYSSNTLHVVDRALSTLGRRRGTKVFAAEYSSLSSQVLDDEIEKAIGGCHLFALLLSHDARVSG